SRVTRRGSALSSPSTSGWRGSRHQPRLTHDGSKAKNRQSAIVMQNSSAVANDRHHKPASQRTLVTRKTAGRAIVVLASVGSLLVLLVQILRSTETITAGFADLRPILFAFLLLA